MSHQPWLLTNLRLYTQCAGDKSTTLGPESLDSHLSSNADYVTRGKDNLSLTHSPPLSRIGTIKTCLTHKVAGSIKINTHKINTCKTHTRNSPLRVFFLMNGGSTPIQTWPFCESPLTPPPTRQLRMRKAEVKTPWSEC